MPCAALALIATVAACGGGTATAPSATDVDFDPPPRAGVAGTPRATPAAHDAVRPIAAKRRSPRRAWRGRTIDFDVKDADLHNVFRLLADVGGVNIVVADSVRGTVTMRLRQVPWDQVLDAIVRSKGLTIQKRGGIYLVSAGGAAILP